MLEIPESIVVSEQLNKTIAGKRIAGAVAASSPHKFAWFFGDPAAYDSILRDHRVERAYPLGGRVEIAAEGMMLHFGDGAILRYYEPGEQLPAKHQLLITFDDDSALVGTVAMYGGLWAFPDGAMDDNIYYSAAKHAVPPLSGKFNYDYFISLFDDKTRKLSAKAFLATEQRIPGLGNGVLQDILLNAMIHPKKKISELTEGQLQILFDSIKGTLGEMVSGGGRDTERDLLGNPGGYRTKLSKNSLQYPCRNCGDGMIHKETYMGGSIYYCDKCQQL